MNTKNCFYFCLFVFVLLTACKKDTAPTKTDLLARTWQADEATIQQGAVSITAYKKGGSSNLADFSKFRLIFKKDGTFNSTDTDGAAAQGTWKFVNNETQLEIKEGSDPIQLINILKLTSTNFDLSFAETEQGITTTVTLKLIPL
ncbi:hypothetical protein [Thermoflexibacter ruber]|uniref:Lipocalin-like domain-containing protein n=1 Tax=Thermoflexibacter ruber TaxID=1003 RepID=A0A1I2IV31_9BACT|nr:hypothetical protein [Thermoflexibacter ruber]SFF46322.1 hypothetical protein SAMN04488541_103741 [Thermoflexibacter ruber]